MVNHIYTNKDLEEEQGAGYVSEITKWGSPSDVYFQDHQISLTWDVDEFVLFWNVTKGIFGIFSNGDIVFITKEEFEKIRSNEIGASVVFYSPSEVL